MNVAPEAFVEKLGKEDAKARKYFYLITFSRILLGTFSTLGSGLRDVDDDDDDDDHDDGNDDTTSPKAKAS